MLLVSLCSHALKKRVTIAYCMLINNNNNNNDNGDNDDDGFQVQKPYNSKTVKYFTLMNLFHFSLN